MFSYMERIHLFLSTLVLLKKYSGFYDCIGQEYYKSFKRDLMIFRQAKNLKTADLFFGKAVKSFRDLANHCNGYIYHD